MEAILIIFCCIWISWGIFTIVWREIPRKVVDFKPVLDSKERTIGIISVIRTRSGKFFFKSKYLLQEYKIKTFKKEESAVFYINLLHKKENIEGSVTGLKISKRRRRFSKLQLSYTR